MIILKICPFCGGNPILVDDYFDCRFFVKCKKCKAHITAAYMDSDSVKATDHVVKSPEVAKLEVVNLWNRRMYTGYKIGRWKEVHGYVTPGGDPVFGCANCGGSEHCYGVEHPKKKLICDNCGYINLYPWEKSYDETSSLAQDQDQKQEAESV